MEQLKKKRKLAYVEASRLHLSRILPKREISPELRASLKQDGIQYPIIARPSPFKHGAFEIVDGGLRQQSFTEDQKVLVDIRYDLNDMEVFRISEATFRRKPRNTVERAKFYSSWVRAVEIESGKRGSQTKVAAKAGISQAEVSHYLSINKLFDRLQTEVVQESIFNALKNQSVNKLYALSKVEDKHALVKIATIIADEPDITVQKVRGLIEVETGFERELERELEKEAETEEDKSRWEFQLRKASADLAGTLHQTDKTLTTLNTSVMNSPGRFLSYDIVNRIRNVLKALRKIEKEASEIISSTRKTQGKEGV